MGLSHALEAVAMPATMDSLEQEDSSEWQEEPKEELEDTEQNSSLMDK